MPIDEVTIKRMIRDALAEMNFHQCNTPIVKKTLIDRVLDGVTTVVPNWEIVFTCDNPEDRNHRHKAKFSVEAPPEKSEHDIQAEISLALKMQLGQ